jgi:hypothetical protein
MRARYAGLYFPVSVVRMKLMGQKNHAGAAHLIIFKRLARSIWVHDYRQLQLFRVFLLFEDFHSSSTKVAPIIRFGLHSTRNLMA